MTERREANKAAHAAKMNKTPEQVVTEVAELAPTVLAHTRIHGVWVWIDLTSDQVAGPDADALRAIGFHYSTRRNAWAHSCGYFRRFNPRINPMQAYAGIDGTAVMDHTTSFDTAEFAGQGTDL